MKIKKIFKNKNNGFLKGVSVIEALVLIFVFSIATLSFYSVFAAGSKYILNSKNRIIAVSLANERMEFLRNLAYDDVAIVGGIPSGTIDPSEDIVVGDKSFHVTTDVRYDDDPMDGIALGSPADVVPNDYKFAEIMVKWGQQTVNERVVLSTRFVPPGVENSVGGGTFSINSIDSAGNPVGNVDVNISNNNVSPAINYSTHTDSNGNLLLQGVPSDVGQNYKITMSKTDYETVRTYSLSEVSYIPENVHLNIVGGVLNEKTMVLDLLSDMQINSKDAFGNDLPDVTFTLIGGRRMDDKTVNPGVFSYSDTITTDGDGEFSDSDINSGQYKLSSFSFGSGNYEFRKIVDGDDLDSSAFNLAPGANFSTDVVFMDSDLDSAYIKIKDSTTEAVISGASVNLMNITLGYNVTLTTDKYGYVYFPNDSSVPLQNGQVYQVLVSASGYSSNMTTITINKLTNKEISLTSS